MSDNPESVAVVGGGVIGLTTALTLAEAGHRVRCVRDRPAAETVSMVAGGLWFPYHVEPRSRTSPWALKSYARFRALAGDPATGVRLAAGTLVDRTAAAAPTEGADRWWAEGLPGDAGVADATAAQLPPGADAGTRAILPLVDTSRFLPWLEDRCRAAGVALEHGHVADLDELSEPALVVAAGLSSAGLLGDPGLSPGRGQVVRLANPGITEWLVDDDAPEGLTYVLPHRDIVVCGGTDVAGAWSEVPDPATEAAILRRCRAAVPALRDAPVVGRAVGLRPLADQVRLARHERNGRLVITNYGHGGAGVTLSWGCAAEVARLLA